MTANDFDSLFRAIVVTGASLVEGCLGSHAAQPDSEAGAAGAADSNAAFGEGTGAQPGTGGTGFLPPGGDGVPVRTVDHGQCGQAGYLEEAREAIPEDADAGAGACPDELANCRQAQPYCPCCRIYTIE